MHLRAELWNAGFSLEHVCLAGYSFAFLYYFSAAGAVAAHYVQRDV